MSTAEKRYITPTDRDIYDKVAFDESNSTT
jgi:hypothetical protein